MRFKADPTGDVANLISEGRAHGKETDGQEGRCQAGSYELGLQIEVGVECEVLKQLSGANPNPWFPV